MCQFIRWSCATFAISLPGPAIFARDRLPTSDPSISRHDCGSAHFLELCERMGYQDAFGRRTLRTPKSAGGESYAHVRPSVTKFVIPHDAPARALAYWCLYWSSCTAWQRWEPPSQSVALLLEGLSGSIGRRVVPEKGASVSPSCFPSKRLNSDAARPLLRDRLLSTPGVPLRLESVGLSQTSTPPVFDS